MVSELQYTTIFISRSKLIGVKNIYYALLTVSLDPAKAAYLCVIVLLLFVIFVLKRTKFDVLNHSLWENIGLGRVVSLNRPRIVISLNEDKSSVCQISVGYRMITHL